MTVRPHEVIAAVLRDVIAVGCDTDEIITDSARVPAAACGFALVVGVDRAHDPDSGARLLEHGADIVVHDLADLLQEGVRR
ncbi:hypothetical protein [Streptomyces sviceus]|uniref:hypothetical protein n=1 Tax=Streptomyces sviceus TaxID=285530 RepID=UPI0036EEC9C5